MLHLTLRSRPPARVHSRSALDLCASARVSSSWRFCWLHPQLSSSRGGGDTEVVKLLVDQGADTQLQGGPCGSALQAASVKGCIGVVKLLLDSGANVNA